MNATHYCFECGAPLTLKQVENRFREVCERCGWVNYAQLKVSAGALVEKGETVLLVQRACDPWRGCWHFPSGFVEVDEAPARAAEREVGEESGLIVAAGPLVNAYLYQDDPRGNGVILIYRAKVIGGKLTTSSETLESGFFSAEAVKKLSLAGVSGSQEVSDWIRSRENGKTHD